MYRTSADPNPTEVVYTQEVSTAAGNHSVGILAALSLICLVMLGVTLKSHSVLSAGSVATKDLEPYTINQGNPAVFVRERVIEARAERR